MKGYTVVDYAKLGLVAVIAGVIFALTWRLYDIGKIVGGPIVARALSYGLWFIGAPLAATMIKKPLSGFLGETVAALVETLLPTEGGYTNLIYGVFQGLASELAYLIFRYRKWGVIQGAIAGALAGPVAVILDSILFYGLVNVEVLVLWIIAATVSGAIYGAISSSAVKAVIGD